MNETPLPADGRFDLILRDAWLWIDQNTVRIGLALAAGAVIVAILYFARMGGRRLARSSHPWWGVIGRALGSMRLWFMAIAAAQIVSLYAHPPEDLAKTIGFLFTIGTTFQAAIFVRELTLGAVEVRAGEADPHGSLSSAIGLIRFSVTAGLFIVATILILSNLGVNVTGLIAGLGVGGIAIGLAAQGIFADLFAALVILFDKPFRKGDIIRWEKGGGTVREVGLKSTRVQSTTGELLIVANTKLLAGELTNITESQRRRVTQPLLLVYATPPETLAKVPRWVREIVDQCEDCHFLRCNLETLLEAKLEFVLTYDIDGHSFAQISERKHVINMAILSRFAAEGIAFADPDGAPLGQVASEAGD